LQNFQVIKLTALFCSYQHKYKHPEHGSKAKEHKACIMQRITKDDGADEFDAEFSISYPHPFSVYCIMGRRATRGFSLRGMQESERKNKMQEERLEVLVLVPVQSS
jgi:hypothetical protein